MGDHLGHEDAKEKRGPNIPESLRDAKKPGEAIALVERLYGTAGTPDADARKFFSVLNLIEFRRKGEAPVSVMIKAGFKRITLEDLSQFFRDLGQLVEERDDVRAGKDALAAMLSSFFNVGELRLQVRYNVSDLQFTPDDLPAVTASANELAQATVDLAFAKGTTRILANIMKESRRMRASEVDMLMATHTVFS